MPVVYDFNGCPYVRKLRLFLAEKGVEYEFRHTDPYNPDPEFFSIHPLARVPALRDGDMTLADSSVICAYYEKKVPEPALYPGAPYPYARALWYEEYADTAMGEPISLKIFKPLVYMAQVKGLEIDRERVDRAIESELPPIFNYLEKELAGPGGFVENRFTIADASVGGQLVNLHHAGTPIDGSRWPKLAEYFNALLERPSFKNLIAEEKKEFEALVSSGKA